MSTPDPPVPSEQKSDFGANEWLVYELHQQYLRNPGSVSEQWREFLSDYRPDPSVPATVSASFPRSEYQPKPSEPQTVPVPSVYHTSSAETGRRVQSATIPLTVEADVARRDALRKRVQADLAARKSGKARKHHR